MNSCILMAEIIQEPQLRHTPDGMELAEMMVQFPGTRQDDPPSMLRVIGWGNVAKEIYQNHHQGDSVLLEGRLNMNTIDRPEGFKEKRAELTVQRIHLLGAITTNSSPSIPVASSQKAVPGYESQFPTPTPGTSSFGVFPQNNPEEPIPQRTNFAQNNPEEPIPQRTNFAQNNPEEPIPQRTNFAQNDPEEPIPQRTNFQQATSPVAKNQDPDVDDIPF